MKLPMRSLLIRRISILRVLLLVGLLTASLPASAVSARPNIILILADDLGWADTTLYGKTSLYETPNIERLAARGMTFTDVRRLRWTSARRQSVGKTIWRSKSRTFGSTA